MRAIVRSGALLCVLAVLADADAHDDVMEVVTKMAAALTEVTGPRDGGVSSGNVSEFMSAVSKDMPEYETLKNNVAALVKDAEISSSVQPLHESEQGQEYSIELDWLLQVRGLEQDGPVVRRREVIHCELRKEKKHWKIVALKPVDFFAAAARNQ